MGKAKKVRSRVVCAKVTQTHYVHIFVGPDEWDTEEDVDRRARSIEDDEGWALDEVAFVEDLGDVEVEIDEIVIEGEKGYLGAFKRTRQGRAALTAPQGEEQSRG